MARKEISIVQLSSAPASIEKRTIDMPKSLSDAGPPERGNRESHSEWRRKFELWLDLRRRQLDHYRNVADILVSDNKDPKFTTHIFRHSWMLDLLIDLSNFAVRSDERDIADSLLASIDVTMLSIVKIKRMDELQS